MNDLWSAHFGAGTMDVRLNCRVVNCHSRVRLIRSMFYLLLALVFVQLYGTHGKEIRIGKWFEGSEPRIDDFISHSGPVLPITNSPNGIVSVIRWYSPSAWRKGETLAMDKICKHFITPIYSILIYWELDSDDDGDDWCLTATIVHVVS